MCNRETRGWCTKFATGLNIIIGCSSKSMWVIKLFLCQNDPLMGESFWQNNSLITHILFELQSIMIFSPVANFGHHPLGRCAASGFGWSKVGNAWLIFQWNISFSSHSSESVLVEVVVGPGSRGGSVAWQRRLAAAVAGPITGQQQVWPSRSFIYLAVWAAAVGRWKILRDLDENASPSRSKLHHQC